jgi:hypothetical protein
MGPREAGSNENQWLQVEISGGKLVTSCYRLRHVQGWQLRSWSLWGSNDASLAREQWTMLDRRHQEHQGQYRDFDSFPAVGGPFQYFRLVCDGPKWNGLDNLVVKHFDLFGVLISYR